MIKNNFSSCPKVDIEEVPKVECLADNHSYSSFCIMDIEEAQFNDQGLRVVYNKGMTFDFFFDASLISEEHKNSTLKKLKKPGVYIEVENFKVKIIEP